MCRGEGGGEGGGGGAHYSGSDLEADSLKLSGTFN